MGAAAVLYLGASEIPDTVVHYHLGPSELHSTYDAEWVGVLLAVWLLSIFALKCDVGSWEGVSIYADNQSVIKMAPTRKVGPSQHLMEAFQETAYSLKPFGQYIVKFKLMWISSHSDVARNERADQEAKLAAAGLTSEHALLPPALRRDIPLSKSSLIQRAKKIGNNSMEETVGGLPTKGKTQQIRRRIPIQKLPQTS